MFITPEQNFAIKVPKKRVKRLEEYVVMEHFGDKTPYNGIRTSYRYLNNPIYRVELKEIQLQPRFL